MFQTPKTQYAIAPTSRFRARRPRQGTLSGRRQFLPRVDLMEDRTLLSTVTVMNNNDGGPGSLRAAVAGAVSGETINFAGSLSGETIPLTSGPLTIGVSLTIDGLGAKNLTISGGGNQNVFTVSLGVAASIEALTIANGLAVQGGGIDNFGDLTVSNCTLLDNQAIGGSGDSTTQGAANGGGIANEVGAALTVTNSTFQGNNAVASPGNDSFGGGLLNLGEAAVSGCTFAGNHVTGGGSTSYYAGSYGGGLFSFDNSILTVSNSTFIGNESIAASGPYYSDAAALDVEIGAVATISNTRFVGNAAAGGSGVTAQGGAVFGEFCTLTFSKCSFTDNQAIGGNFNSSVFAGSAAEGGAVFFFSGALSFTDCTLTGNQAVGGSGAASSSTPTYDGQAEGGAIGVEFPGPVSLMNCLLIGNQSIGGSGANSVASHNGIAIGGGISAGDGATVTVSNSMLVHNVAQGGSGTADAGGIGLGGGIMVTSGVGGAAATLTLSNSTLVGNAALGGAGSAGVPGGSGIGGGIGVASEGLFGNTDDSSVSLISSTLAANVAQGGAGGVGADGGDGWGGGIFVGATGSASIANSIIAANLAAGGLGGLGGSDGDGIGGGLYVESGGAVTVTKSHIVGNRASTSNDNIYGSVTYL